MGAALNVFFPQAGGLPTNPCTYATTDWGKCVWQEIKPFVQFFVQQQLNQAFDTFWTARIQGYQSRLWAMNSSAYQDSEHFPNGSVKDMSNATQTKMYDTLFRIYQDMIGDIPLFMANYSINTTAGAYLSQFASLHSSIMVNLMGSLKYRDQGDRFNFQTITACYAHERVCARHRVLQSKDGGLFCSKHFHSEVLQPTGAMHAVYWSSIWGLLAAMWLANWLFGLLLPVLGRVRDHPDRIEHRGHHGSLGIAPVLPPA